MRFKVVIFSAIVIVSCLIFQACKSTKFVPDGEYLLASAEVKSDIKSISDWEMKTYIKQKPNFKTFEVFKLPLSIYNLSGQDSTKWINRKLRHAGEPPVIYDSTQVDKTVSDLQRIMTNKGYLNAEVSPVITFRKKRARITYDIKAGKPYKINDYIIDVEETAIKKELLPTFGSKELRNSIYGGDTLTINLDSTLHRNSLVRKNSIFDLDILDQERDRITSLFRKNGYYAFNKEYVGFVADTTVGNNRVELELSIYPFTEKGQNGQTSEMPHRQYEVTGVDLYIDFNPIEFGDITRYQPTSIYEKNDYRILYGERGEYIKPHVLLNNCFIRPGALYNEDMTKLTYSALSQLRILKNVNISYIEFLENDSTKLHCIITCVPDKKQGVSTELEGTNSGGFFGVGAGVGYLHRNAFRGAEQFNVRLRGSYEAITPNFSSFSENYFEIGGETSLTFPRFMFPMLSKDFRKRTYATTQLKSNYTYQRRPGFFSRTVFSAGVKYAWQDRREAQVRHAVDLVDISYIRVPQNSLDSTFKANLTEAARRYSFTNQFIMSAGYAFTKTNAINYSTRFVPSIYSLRASIETAGNVLALAALIADTPRDSVSGSRQVFGTNFAQYAKGTLDYSKTYFLDEKNSVAWHVGGGLAYPYGNFKQIPIEKRFFSGGANNVRGWGVRSLGPGSFFTSDPAKNNFYFHSGDMRMDANIEYRSKLFWIMELGAFIDAGNIWTVKGYEGQEQGQFELKSFYKEIALAWGLGFRLNFDFVLIRLDAGWKAYDPANNPNGTRWPITEPYKINKNVAWHIAVGYPF